MKQSIPFFSLLLAVVVTSFWNGNEAIPQTKEHQTAKEKKTQVLRHVVMFKFKDDATAEQIRKVEQAFARLPEQIDAIKSFEWGTNNSPEGLDKGFTHCFVVTFADTAGREEYLPHPKHKAFVKILRPILDDVLVIDFWAHK